MKVSPCMLLHISNRSKSYFSAVSKVVFEDFEHKMVRVLSSLLGLTMPA